MTVQLSLLEQAAECRSCSAPIVWAVTEKGKRAPFDLEPVAEGTVVLVHAGVVGEPPLARVVTAAERLELEAARQYRVDVLGIDEPAELRLFRSHFATCPHASSHRRRS